MTSPTMLFGVDAPAVRPTERGPAGSQFEVTTSGITVVEGAPMGRCRISVADTRQAGSARWTAGSPRWQRVFLLR